MITNAALLRHLAAHPYRNEIIVFLLQEAFRQHVRWQETLLDLVHEIDNEAKP